eukprot:2264363-Lingulodinium_polyedra.AAC.1
MECRSMQWIAMARNVVQWNAMECMCMQSQAVLYSAARHNAMQRNWAGMQCNSMQANVRLR